MKLDTLNRRVQWAGRSPRVARLAITSADLAIFEAIDRHGPLPSHYLYEFSKHLRADKSQTLNRLTEFYHGTHTQRPFLERPAQQFAQFNAHARHTVYDLTQAGRQALAEEGRLARHSPRRSDPFVHQLMNGFVAASIELTCPLVGVSYVPRETILSEAPEASRRAANPMALPLLATKLIPDDLFALQFPDGWRRYCAVEVDRNTESIDRTNAAANTITKKVQHYVMVLEGGVHRTWWGLPNLGVLIVTPNERHAANILDCVQRHAGWWSGHFAVQVVPEFGSAWRVPSSVLAHLLTTPWTTTEGSKDLSKL